MYGNTAIKNNREHLKNLCWNQNYPKIVTFLTQDIFKKLPIRD
jgi:hypothetical protein